MERQTILKVAGVFFFLEACDEGERIGRASLADEESDAGPDDCSEGPFLAGGDGSSGDPYQIEWCCDLQAMENDLDAHYEITGWPDCTGFDAGDSKGFRPVGTISTPFEGTLQGNGRPISGLAMDRPGDDYLGLFGVTDGATIAELGLINGTSIEGDDYLGALVGKAIDTSITHVHANAVIQGDNHIGILFGALDDATVLESYAFGNSLCDDNLCGYLAGEVTGTTTVTDSFAAGGIWDGVPSLYGPSPSVTTTESFFDCEYVSSCSPSHPTKQSTANMEDPEFFIGQGWNYSTVWGVRNAGVDYPCLLFEGLCDPYVSCDSDDPTCDGVDDDCDESFDEDYDSVPTECGEGVCVETGSTSCVDGEVVDSCEPAPTTGLDWDCDEIDQDCDGEVDEGYFSVPTRCGVGGCARNGVTSCVDGEEEDSCEAGTPAGSDATCNGVDDDCDEETDEGYSNTSTSCGVAACASTGTLSCAGGVEYDSCVPGVSSLFDTTCNSTDDDCDGTVDEDCCAPASCGAQGKTCGFYDNGCGTLLNCGSCPAQVCSAGGSCITGLGVEAGPNRSAVWGETVRFGDDDFYNWAVHSAGGSVTCTWDFGDSSTDVVVTNCQGFGNAGAEHAFDAPGVYTVTLSAAGPSSSTANDTMTVTVGKRPTEVVVIGAAETATEGEYDVTARLFDFFDPSTSVSGLTVDITYNSTTLSDTADADGEATVLHELPNETVTIEAEFDGDTLYEASETSAALRIDGEDVEKLGEPTAGYEGRRFVLGFPQNTRNLDTLGNGDNISLRLHLSSRTATVATVSAPGASFEVTAAVVPGKTTVIELPNSLRMGVASLGHAEGYSESGRIQDRGIEVTSDDPIAVYGLDLIQQSSDAYLALPVESLGTEYVVLAYPNEKLVHGYTQSGGTQIGIVATEDDTDVTITPTVNVAAGPDLLSGIDAGETITISLDENETLLLANQGNSSELTVWEDLSGTIINSSAPISVFAGHACSSVTQAACDHLVEQIPPADTLGRRFLTVPLALRRAGDSYQILATVDDTIVRVDGEELAVLDRGEVRYFEIGSQRYSVVEATEPVLLAQFSKGAIADGALNEIGDPFMMLVPPEEQELSTYLVTTAPAFWPPDLGTPLEDRHFLNLVVRGEDIDGVRINNQRIGPVWYAIGDSGWSGAQVEVTRGLTTRVHHVRSDVGIGLRAYGFADFDSYGYAAGMRMQARACERTLATPADGVDNDCDGRHDEERANGTDDDGDGLIDEDLGEGELGVNLAPVIYDTSFSIPVSNDDTNIPLQTRSVTLRGFDPNGDPLEYEIVTPPTRGTATISGRTLTYTSLRYFTVVGGSNYTGGAQTIDVRATDGELFSSTEQVFISVTSKASCDGPTCGNERPEMANNSGWVVHIPGTDPTATLSDRIEAYDANRDPISFIPVTVPSGLVLDGATGEFTWTADRGDVGNHTFVFDMSDGRSSAVRTTRNIQVTVNGSNSRPIFTTEPVTTVFVSESYSYDANAVDAESHSITYSLDTAPTETDIDPVTGMVSGTPEDPGTYSIIVRATDSLSASSVQGYTLTVYGEGPTIVSSPVLLATADVAYRYDAHAVHPNVGEDLTWWLDDPPAGMTIDTVSGLIEWTPDADEDIDEHIIRVVVEDESSNEDDQIYTLDVIARSDAPRITSLARTDARVDALYVYDVDAEDPDDGDVLTYELATAPAGMSIFASSGVIQWIPSASGSFPVEVLVRDLADNIDRQAFIVEVRPDLAGPAITLTATKIFLESAEETTLTVTLRGDYDPGSLTLEIDPPGGGSNIPLTLDGDLSADYDSNVSGRHLAIATAEDASGNIATTTLALAVEASGDSTAPTVAITSPEDDDVLTYIHDVIGTVSDANLLRYELALRPVNQPDGWIPVHEGYATVSAAELGEIDTTLLENGYYELRLLAEDVNEQSSSTSVRVRVHGDAKIGLVRLSFVDVAIEMAGIPLAVVRTYDSRRAALNGDFGYGWQLDLSAGHVQPNRAISDGFAIYTSSAPFSLPCAEVHDQKTHFVEVRVSPQEWYVFRPTIENTEAVTGGCTGEVFFELIDGKFDGASLQVLGNNLVRSTNHGSLASPPSSPSFLYDEFTSELYDPHDFQLVTYDGRVFDLTLERGITRISDFAGNSLFFYPHQIAHTDGRAIHLDRDAQGRIVRVTDPMGHSVRYTYDAGGDLVGVSDLTGGYTQFLYEEPAFEHYLTTIIDPRGNRAAAIDYDSDGRLRGTCDAESGCTLAEYDLVEQTQSIEDPTRIPTDYEYDDFGNVVRQTDALDNDKTFTYDDYGNLLTETDELGNETVYERNRNGQLLSETRPVPPGGDPDDYTTTYTYSENGPRESITYPSGGGYRWLIDSRATESMWGSLQPRRMADHEGNILYEREFGYRDILLAHTDRQGRREYEYTTSLVVPSVIHEADATTTTIVTDWNHHPLIIRNGDVTARFTYDEAGRPLTEDYGNGVTVNYEYGGRNGEWTAIEGPTFGRYERTFSPTGRVIGWTLPNGDTHSRRFDGAGRVSEETGPDGVRTSYQYDELGRLETQRNEATGAETTFEYDDAGNLTRRTDAEGGETESTYVAGELVAVEDPLGGVTEYERTPTALTTTDPLDRETITRLTPLGLTREMEYDDGSTTTTDYLGTSAIDGSNLVTSARDELDRQRTHEYDARGGLISATWPGLPNEWSYEYDRTGLGDIGADPSAFGADGGPATAALAGASSDPYAPIAGGSMWPDMKPSFERILGHRLSSVTTPLGDETITTFNAQGREEAIELPFGETETFTYGADGYLDEHELGDGTTLTFTHDATGRELTRTDGTESRTITYGPNDRIETVVGPTGTVDYDYDAAGRMTAITTPAGGTVEYAYDPLDRTTEVTVVVGATRLETTYEYDDAGNILSITDPESGVTTYDYDVAGRLETRTLPNGIVSTWTYDERDRVLSIVHRNPTTSTTLASREYERDLSGAPTRIENEDGTYVIVTYDAGNRLEREEHHAAGGAVTKTISYEYDADSNRIGRTLDGIEETYDHDPGALLLETSVGGTPVSTFAYDGQGRTTSITRAGVDYDLEYSGLLSDDGGYVTSIEDGGLPLATYEFDGEGRRERVTHDGVERRYLIAPSVGRGLESVHAVVDDEGDVVVAYVYEGEHALMRIDAGGDITYYLRDTMGTVVGLTDDTATSTGTFRYDGFGNVLSATGSASALPVDTLGDFRFQGMWLDSTDLYFVRARGYDGVSGRFLNRDPIDGTPGEPASYGVFMFSRNNAFNFRDPTGETSVAESVVVLAIQYTLNLAATITGAVAIACILHHGITDILVDFGVDPSGDVCTTRRGPQYYQLTTPFESARALVLNKEFGFFRLKISVFPWSASPHRIYSEFPVSREAYSAARESLLSAGFARPTGYEPLNVVATTWPSGISIANLGLSLGQFR